MEKRILIKLLLLFIPAACVSYLFHEFGHWIIGEILGYDMGYSIHGVWLKSGDYSYKIHDLFITIGGIAFTIFLSILSLIIIEKYKLVYAYPLVFYQLVYRLSLYIFLKVSFQDERKISTMLNIGSYIVTIIVSLLLFLIVLKASLKLKINLMYNCFCIVMCLPIVLMLCYGYRV